MSRIIQTSFFWLWLLMAMASSMVNPSSSARGGSSRGDDRDEQREKKRKIAKGKKVAQSSKKRVPSDDEEEEDEPAGNPDNGWKKSLQNRGVKCERQVDFRSEPLPMPVQVMMNRGMDFWSLPVHGYSLWMVREFYANMTYNDHHQVIESTVRGHSIAITPDTVAASLCYTRPIAPLLPMRPLGVEIVDQRIVRDTIVAKRGGWTGSHFVLGSLHLNFQLVNKILHYNLLPKGTEKMPSKRAAEMIYAFMQPDIVIDFALWIWMEMRDFLTESSLRTSMPFPAMITRIVRAQLGGRYMREELTPGNPGAITEASWKKAATHSQPPPPSSSDRPSSSRFGATYEPKEKSGWKRIEEFLRTILCRQDDIIKSQKKLKSRVEYCMEAAAVQLGTPYESPASSEEDEDQEAGEEEGQEEEYAFGPGALH